MLLSVYSRGLNTYASGEGSVGPRTIGTRDNKDEIAAPDVIVASSSVTKVTELPPLTICWNNEIFLHLW